MRLDRTRIAVRERSQTEILDLSLLVLRTFLVPIVGLVVVIAMPLMLLNWWLIQWMAADLMEESAIGRYVWTMSLLVYTEAPLAGILATLYLGKVTFYEQPTLKTLLGDAGTLAHRILWTQVILRGVLLFIWLVTTLDVDDSYSTVEGFLPFVCFGLFVWRSLRPYVNEIVLLERSPLSSGQSGPISIGKRSHRLHAPNAGDLFGRGITLVPLAIALGLGLLGSIWFLIATFTNSWDWGPLMVHVVVPGVLWLLMVYMTVVRFLSYLDLRIRREGWEVELQMRAEVARMTQRMALGD